MAFIDALTCFSGGANASSNAQTFQTVTGSTAVLSTNTMDQMGNRDVGQGNESTVLVQVGTAFTGLTALTIDVITADDAALTSNVNVIGSTGAIPVASLTSSARFIIDLSPRHGSKGQRYVGMRYTPTGTGSAGSIYAAVCADVQDTKIYPSGFAVA